MSASVSPHPPRKRGVIIRHLGELAKQAARYPVHYEMHREIHRRIDILLDELAISEDDPPGNLADKLSRLTSR